MLKMCDIQPYDPCLLIYLYTILSTGLDVCYVLFSTKQIWTVLKSSSIFMFLIWQHPIFKL